MADILIVDDDRTNIEALAAALGERHEIRFATNGAQAEHSILERAPDLVLLDVKLPDTDGFSICRRMQARESTSEVPVIFVTVMSKVEEEARGFSVGAVDYIVKPFNPAIVKARVHNHLELKRAKDKLQELSITDALTGLANRRRLVDVLENEVLRSNREGGALSLVMIDVDYFKPYNDHYGHQEGDQCLRKVAATIHAHLRRPADLAARYGGEEFVCVLPQTNLDGAMACAEAIRLDMLQQQIPHESSLVAPWLTLSLGVTTCERPDLAGGRQLLAAVDEQLYRAKSSGRNRTLGDVYFAAEPA